MSRDAPKNVLVVWGYRVSGVQICFVCGAEDEEEDGLKTHIGGRLKDVKYIFGRSCSHRGNDEECEEIRVRKQRKERENRGKPKKIEIAHVYPEESISAGL